MSEGKLSARELLGLRDLMRYHELKRPYWWMPQTMKSLAAKGLAEQYTTPSFKNAWRITDAGRAAFVPLAAP